MDERAVLWEIEGQLATITLNRRQVLNAMNLAWVEGLDLATRAIAAADGVRVVVVRGAGRSFCAGIDLDMLGAERMPAGFYELQEGAFQRLESMDKIVIAALHGHCLGGGLQLAIACDIRVATTDCQLGLPAVLEGLFPGMAPFRLPRLIGLGHARRLILSGEPIAPQDAWQIGLVDYLAPPDAFERELERVQQLYLAAPRTASAASKRLLRRAFEADFETAYRESLPLMADCLVSPEVETAGLAWQSRRAERASSS